MEQWSSLSEFITSEEADFMSQLLANFPVGLDEDCSAMNMAGLDGSSYCGSDSVDSTNSYIFSQENIFPTSSQENYYLGDSHHPILMTNLSSMALDFCIGYDCLNQENLQLKLPAPEPEQAAEDKKNNPSENAKKRSRSSGDIEKKKRNVKLKKINNKEDVNGGLNRQSSSGCCSEDDSNGSQNGGGSSSVSSAALNLNGKIRASRGSATDPQSLYARKRRERINERLRVLQNLVPNGTKVDISTMLEEAVQYVKFLQLQIKLLSSDDLWMYAPLAYNGMDIGLDLKITKPR